MKISRATRMRIAFALGISEDQIGRVDYCGEGLHEVTLTSREKFLVYKYDGEFITEKSMFLVIERLLGLHQNTVTSLEYIGKNSWHAKTANQNHEFYMLDGAVCKKVPL